MASSGLTTTIKAGKMSKYFEDDDFRCKCGCGMDVSEELKRLVFAMREDAQVPFIITSGARCEKHNGNVGGKAGSAHVSGLAVDIAYSTSSRAYAIESAPHTSTELSALVEIGD